jgi:hypothetical protein
MSFDNPIEEARTRGTMYEALAIATFPGGFGNVGDLNRPGAAHSVTLTPYVKQLKSGSRQWTQGVSFFGRANSGRRSGIVFGSNGTMSRRRYTVSEVRQDEMRHRDRAW